MNEETGEDDYQGLHHFISSSVWDPFPLMNQIGRETSELFNLADRGVSLQLDESAHLKKGKESAGVSRQYAGVSGKVENCQVGVYASLVRGSDFGLVNCRLYLPESWTGNKQRCDKAGIPEAYRTYKTKPQLALEMVQDAVGEGLEFDWVGGDALYGNSPDLVSGLERLGLNFVLDINGDKHIYLQQPELIAPAPYKGRGRPVTTSKVVGKSVSVLDYARGLDKREWQRIKIRKATKGWLSVWSHVVRVWVVPRNTAQIQARTLILRKVPGRKKEFKYSLSNYDLATTSIKKLVWMQAQRHFIEQSFRVAKTELGMSDYQVRKWEAWYKHQSMVMMALSFIIKQKMIYKLNHPLTSLPDIRKLSQALLEGNLEKYFQRLEQMKKRHKQRGKDIQRYYRDG